MKIVRRLLEYPAKFHIQETEKKTMCGLVADDFIIATEEELRLTQRHCSACHRNFQETTIIPTEPKPEYII